MIYGIGVDLVKVARIERVLGRYGDRFCARVFTEREIAYCRGKSWAAAAFAMRFAAKEAFSKAIGTGIRSPFGWHSVAVGRDGRGKPGLVPSPDMARHLAGMGVTASHLSLTDDAGVAMAFVVLEG